MTREPDHLAKVRVAGSNPVVRSQNSWWRAILAALAHGIDLFCNAIGKKDIGSCLAGWLTGYL